MSHLALISGLIAVLVATCQAPSSSDSAETPDPGSPVRVPQPGLPCESPAPLQGTRNAAAPGYIVVFKDGTPAASTAEAIARKQGFTIRFVYTSLPGFAASFPDQVLDSVRCESSVKYVEYEGTVSTGGG